MRRPHAILVLALFIVVAAARAQEPSFGDILEAKKLFESTISSRITDELSTRLPREEFTVSARVELIKSDPPDYGAPISPEDTAAKLPQRDPDRPEAFLPSMIGLVDAEAIVQSYEAELKKTRAQLQNTATAARIAAIQKADPARWEYLSRYEIAQVEINVGISKKYDETYRAQIDKWLKNRVRAEFAGAGSGSAHIIETPPPPKVEPPKVTPPAPQTPLDLLSKLEGFFSIVFATSVFLICFLLWLAFGRRAEKKEQSVLSALLRTLQRPERPSRNDPNAPKVESRTEKIFAAQELERIKEELKVAMAKVSRVIESLSVFERRALVGLLARKDSDGRIKAAFVIDAWFSNQSSAKDLARPTEQQEIFGWLKDIDLPLKRKFDLIEEWRRLSSLSAQDRLRYANEVFWDTVAYKTMGQLAVEQPFEYLRDLSGDQIRAVLGKKDRQLQGLVMLFLPAPIQKEILAKATKEEQAELLRSCFRSPTVDAGMLDGAHNQIKDEILRAMDLNLSVVDRIGGLLGQLGALDEIRLLRESMPQLGPEADRFKRRHATLAFVDEWTGKDALARLLTEATNDEIVSLVAELPHILERVVALSSPVIAQIIRQDIAAIASQGPGVKGLHDRAGREANLASLSAKLKDLVQSGQIDLNEAIAGGDGHARDSAA